MSLPDDNGSNAVALAQQRYRLMLGGRFRGGIGGRRGQGSGGGQDFLDYRNYTLGDDLRHLDWRGLARTDQLRVRLFEEEVAPTGCVLVDLSESMAASKAKRQALLDLARLFMGWVSGEGGRARCLQLGGGVVADPAQADFHRGEELRAPAVPLPARGVRVLLSDFLVPGDPAPLLRRLAEGASRLFVVQLLDGWERRPEVAPAATLVDCETDQRIELLLDRKTVAAYVQRLERLQEALATAVASVGGTFAEVLADSAEAMCKNHLMPAGIVEPAP